MQYISIFLRSIVIITLFLGINSGAKSPEKLDLVEQTIEAVKNCMEQSPSPWLGEWNQEYLETIRKEVESHRDASNFAERLEILRKGFATYWESFKKIPERSLFEVHQAQIRWYTEHLMGSEFPTEKERQKLSDQYKDIWDHASDSLLRQFPFLDPNAVQKAKALDLSVCYSKINAPLMPVYLRPFSDEQVEKIKHRWDKIRYDRVDVWSSLNDKSKTSSGHLNEQTYKSECDYKLTKESLSQLLGLVWTIVPQHPEYYIAVIENRNEVLKHRVQEKRQARLDQQRMEKERSRQLLQTEHISFLIAALLEKTLCLDGIPSISIQEQNPLEQQDKSAKGGGAYDVGIVSTEK